MNPPNSTVLSRYRNALAELERHKADRFYPGTHVLVNCSRYHGHGIAVTDNQCPPDQIAVRLENGNVWWYPLEACRPWVWDDQEDAWLLKVRGRTVAHVWKNGTWHTWDADGTGGENSAESDFEKAMEQATEAVRRQKFDQ